MDGFGQDDIKIKLKFGNDYPGSEWYTVYIWQTKIDWQYINGKQLE